MNGCARIVVYAVLTLGFTIKSPPSSSLDVVTLYIVGAFLISTTHWPTSSRASMNKRTGG
jgi:hypothetical protein